MSSPEARLKQQIASILNVPVDSVTPDTSLDLPRFRSSAGAMILQSIVRTATGNTGSTAGVRNFGELLARVTGQAAPNGVSAAEAAQPAVIPPEVSGSLVQVGLAAVGCGVDIEEVATMPDALDFWAHDFYTTHFSPEEIAYCVSQSDPRPHFAARWCAKEALKKASPIYLPLAPADIQVVRHPAGSVGLQVRTAGQWRDAPAAVSLSHSEQSAIGMVILQSRPPQDRAPATAAAEPVAGSPRINSPPAATPARKLWLRRLFGS
jgi:holo-[acyl-carrier protein] synthase